MNVILVTPAAKRSRSGNRVTAVRWASVLRQLGHRVTIRESFEGESADVMVAIHAWRSARSVAAFRRRYPERALIVLLSGTDIYRFQRSHPHETLESMEAADRLVGLHDLVAHDLPSRFHRKLRIIHQSASPLPGPRCPSRRTFDVCVVGHLREEKDPLRAAIASRELPPRSRIRVVHLGKAHDDHWSTMAREEMARNPRYVWRGEVPRSEVRRCFGRSHLMVVSSIMEGGANVVSEAVVAGLPVLASKIPGNVGLLGTDHPAYFSPRDTSRLAPLLARAEAEPAFVAAVRAHGDTRAALFRPAREREAWRILVDELR